MGYIRKKLIVFTLLLFSTVALLTGCTKDKYKNLKLDVDKTDIEIVLSDNDEENVFSITSTVSKLPKGYDGAVSFTMPVNDFIEEVDVAPQVNNGVSTAYYKAKKQGGPVIITVKTTEGNLEKQVTVKVTKPITSLNFTQTTIPVVKGERTDISKFISFNPNGTTQNGIKLELTSGDQTNELIKVVTDGQYLTVPSDCTLTSFQVRARSTYNDQLATEVANVKVVTIVDKENISLIYNNNTPNTTEDDVALTKNSKGEYNLVLATNAEDNYTKTIYFNFDNKVSENTNYTVTVKGLQDDGSIIDNNVVNSIVQVDKTLNAINSFDIKAIGNGSTQIEFIIERADFPGYEPFRQTITLNIRSEAFPTNITVTNGSNNQSLDEIKLYANYNESASIFGTRFRINVSNETGVMTNQNVILTLSSGGNFIQLYDRFKNAISFNTPISSNADYYMAHTFTTAPTAKITLTITSATFDKIVTTIPINIETDPLVLSTTQPELNIDINHKEIETPLSIDGISVSAFDTLKVELVNENGVDASKFLKYTQTNTSITLSPIGDEIGECKVKVSAENGSEVVFTIVLFESLNADTTTVKIAGQTLSAKTEIGGYSPTVVVKNGLNIPVSFTVNGKNYTTLDNTGLRFSIDSSNTQIVKVPNYHSVETQNAPGTSMITVSITGFNEFGEQNKTLYFQISLTVSIPLTSLNTTNPEVTRYDTATLTANQRTQYGTYDIVLYSSPVNATIDYDSIDWTFTIDNVEYIYGESPSVAKLIDTTNKIITYTFTYRSTCIVTLTTSMTNFRKATVECLIRESTIDSLSFKVNAKVQQSFTNENGVTITSPKQASVRMIIKKAKSVSDYFFTNITEYTIAGTNDKYSEVVFDERDLGYDGENYTNYDNCLKTIPFTVYPSDALNKNLGVSVNNASIEATVDNVNGVLQLRILSPFQDSNANVIVKVYPMDNPDTYKEIRVRVLNGKTEQTAFEIKNVDDLIKINTSLSAYYVLTSNIILDSWTPIGYNNGNVRAFNGNFSGTHNIYDGNGNVLQSTSYSINGMTITDNELDYYGLFAFIGKDAVIHDLTINDFLIRADINRSVNIYAGALAGYSEGIIRNVVINDGSGVANFNGSYYTTLEKGRTNSGIYITANTITTEQSYFFVGGLVGFANGSKYLGNGTFDSKQYYEVNDNYIEKTVKIVNTTANNNDYELYSNADIYNVYSTTQLNVYVKSNNISYVGGLVGFNNKAYIANEDNEDDVTFGKDSANVITSINASLTDEQITNNINSAFGGVVGFNNGVISNVIVKADIIGESENENNEEYYMSNIGGVVGYNIGTIKGTTSYPLLRGYYNVGGIVGKSESAIAHIDNTITLTVNGKEKTYSFINGIGINDSLSSEFLQADKISFNKNFRIKLEKFSNETYDYDGIKQLFKDQFFGNLTDSVIETNINTLYNFSGDIIPDTFTVDRIDYVDLLSKETTTDYSVATTYNVFKSDNSLYPLQESHYYNNGFTTYTIALKLANSGINIVTDNDVEFLNLGDSVKEYNTAIIGYNNVGGAIGQYIGLVGLGDGCNEDNGVSFDKYELYNNYYDSFDSTLKIASVFNYAIYNPIAYNTVYNYTGLKVVPINETGYTGGYYGNILLSDAHSQSVSNSHRNYAGGLVGYMSNGAVSNSQVFADIQGRLAGLGGIVGKAEGITQINNSSYIGLIHNKTTGATTDATAATGGIVGDALSATTTFAYYTEYTRSDSDVVDYTYIASSINVVQYESDLFKQSLPRLSKFTAYNNISNSYFMANTLNAGYIETVKAFDKNALNGKSTSEQVKIKLDYYNNTSTGYVGEGKQEIKLVVYTYSAGKLVKIWFDADGTEVDKDTVGATDYLLTKVDALKVNFEYLQNSTLGQSANESTGTTCTKLNEKAYGIDNSTTTAQTVISEFAAQSSTYNASDSTSETGLNNLSDGMMGPDNLKYEVPKYGQYWYLNNQVNNGLPVLLSRQKAIYGTKTIIENNQEKTETIVNRVDLLVNFPPTAINVDYTQNYVDTFIANINSDKTAVISYYELSQDSYDSTGTTIDFGNNNQYSQSAIKNFTNTLSSQVRELNTYGYSEVLNITTIPKFINANSVKVSSSNTSKLSVERGNDGKYKFIAKGAGVVELTITSAYDPSKTKTIIVNIIYASQQLDLSYNNSGKTESVKGLTGKTIDLNKNSSTNPSNISIKSNMKSTYNFESSGGDVNKTFNLVSNYDGGIRYYYLTKKNIDGNNISSIYWISGGEDPTNSGITVNDQQLTTESVKYLDGNNNEQTSYVYYFDVPLSMDAKFKGSNVIQSEFVAIPYVNVYDTNGNTYKKPLIELSSNVNSTIEIDGEKLCGISSTNSEQLNFLKNIIHSFTINVKDINTGLVSSVNSININADMEPVFDVEIETYKSDEDLYITYQDSNYVEYINKIIKDTPIQIADLTLLCTSKDTSTQGIIKYTFNLYVASNNKSNITSSYTKNLRFFVLKDGVEVTPDESGFVNAELHSIVDSKLNITIPVTINPQPINEILIRHYPNSEITITTDSDGKKITNVNLNEIAYDNIIPGHVGILKVYISPEYAYYDRVEIVSSVDANTVVQFEQMVANATETEYGIYYSGNYETLVTDYVSINNGITLQKNSYINQNNQVVYNGYLYIRTLINSFVTDANSFTLTVRVYKNGSDTPIKTQSITLNVQAPPSLTMSMTDGSSVGVVARGTEQEFTVKTNDFNGVVDFSESYLYRISNVSGSEIVLGEINSQFSVKYSNNKYYLVTDVNLEYGNYIKLIGKISKSINGEVITSEAELTIKIVDYIIEEISVENMSDGYITGLFNQPYALILRISKAKYNSTLSALVNDKIRTLEKRYSQATHVVSGSEEYNKPYIWYSVDTSKANANSGRYVSLNIGRNSSESYIISTIENYLDLDNISVYTVQNIKFGSGDTLAGRIKYVYDSTDIKPILSDSDDVIYNDNAYYYTQECEFKFNFYRFRDEEHPDPIQTAEQLKNMEDGVDYILVNDITLTDWTPLRSDLKINSLDGNGYVIKIESFNLESYADDKELIDNVDIGIFSKINSGTTIKNLIIEVAPKSTNSNIELANYDGTDVDLYVDARAYKNVTFGLLAAENAGLITNVQVVYNADSLKEERENITKQYNYTTNITKNGSIRRDLSVIRIDTTTTVESQTHYMAGLVARNLDEGESAVGSITNSSIDNISINGVGYVSGFVVENNGKISSSFYKGGNIINRIAENYNESATSGFAIYNTGDNAAIQYSYTQGRTGEGANGTKYAGESLNGTYDKTALDNNIKNTFAGYNYANGSGKLDSIVVLRAMNSMIDTKSNASAFIFENNAEVSNCYANILVNSVMSTSGFVFRNKANGTISSSYTLSSVKLNDYSSSPFTGRGDQSTYNNENPTGYSDAHYLKLGSDDNATEAEKNYCDEFLDSEEPATYLGASQFKEYNTFQSYAFNTDFEKNSIEKVTRAVWFIPNATSQDNFESTTYLKHKKYVQGRPELVAANLHTVSIKVWTSKDETSNENSYVYASTPIGESIQNPILIRTAEEFNNYLVYDSSSVDDTNRKFALRFISDIAFNKTDLSAKTYTMDYSGDLDGNGMTIEHLRLLSDTDFETDESANSQKTVEYLGLFKRIYTSYTSKDKKEGQRGVVRNLNLVVDEVRGSKVTYVGVLAGSVEDGDVFNIDISGSDESIYVQGRNVVGGLAGLVTGDSQIVNITSTINVQSTYFKYSNLFSSQNPDIDKSKYGTFEIYDRTLSTDGTAVEGDGVNNKTQISYVGGIVGVFDNDPQESDDEDNPLSLFNANARKLKVTGNVKLSGEIVGGVFGLVGYTSKVSDITFIVEENATPKIYATRVAGGLIGENRGKIERSYISHSKTLQDKIDAEYKNAVSKSSANIIAYSSSSNYDSLFGRNAHYTGGVIGFNNKGTVENCYSRINVINKDSLYAGGFTGWDISGTYQYCYTTGSVSAYNSVGGFIGLLNRNSYIDGNLDWISENFITKDSEDSKNSRNIGRGQRTLETSTSSLTKLNGVNALNIWRKEDLNNDRSDSSLGKLNIGAFVGKAISITTSKPKISDIFDYSTERTSQAKETNYFIQNSITDVKNSNIAMTEIGVLKYGGNSILSYVNTNDGYKYYTMFADDVRSTKAESVNKFGTDNHTYPVKSDVYDSEFVNYINDDRIYGISGYAIEGYTEIINNKAEEKYKSRLYSRMLNIGSGRTLKEVINTLDVIDTEAKSFGNQYDAKTTGDTFINNSNKISISSTDNYSIYYIWSRTRWTGVEKTTSADLATVFPYLEAKPERTVIEVRTVEDLKLMNTYRTAEFVLMNDITFNNNETWEPVGSMSQPFRGWLHSYKDGNDQKEYSINNLLISRNSMSTLYAGLVGYASEAKFEYFDLNNVDINVSTSATADISIQDGSLFIGALVGYSDAGTSIKNVNMTDCSIESDRAGTVGGLIGYSGLGIIENSKISGLHITINGLGDTSKANNDSDKTLAFGGLVGMITSASADSNIISNPNVSGGISLDNSSIRENTISASESRLFDIGGLVGRVNDSDHTTLAKISKVTVDVYTNYNLNFANDNKAIKNVSVGGIIGSAINTKLIAEGSTYNKVNITVSKDKVDNLMSSITNYSNNFNMGGAIGRITGLTNSTTSNNAYDMSNTHILTSKFSNNSDAWQKLSTTDCASMTANIGGAVGYAENATFSNVYADTNWEIDNNTSTENATYNVGGLFGYINNSQNVDTMYSKGSIKFTANNGINNIGGAFGQVVMARSEESSYSIDKIATDTDIEISLTSNNGIENIGGFVGKIYNGVITESSSTSDIAVLGSDISNANLYVGGFVGTSDITNEMGYLRNTKVRKITINNCYTTSDIDLGNMFTNTAKHKAGLFIGAITTNDTDTKDKTISINNNYTIGKFVYKTINTSAYEERENKGGFLGGFNTNVATLSYISKLKNIVMYNNIYNRDFVSYTNEYGDAKSTKEMLFNSDNTFKGLEVNNLFKDTNKWVINNNSYPQLTWINNTNVVGQSIADLQANGTKVAPDYKNTSVTLNGAKDKAYILDTNNATLNGNFVNTTIYFNTNTKQTTLSSWSNVTLDYKSVIYGLNTSVNSLTNAIVATNNGLIVDTAIPNNLVGTNNGIIYQVTTIGTELSTASNYVVGTNEGLIDSVNIISDTVSGHIYNTSTGTMYRSVVKTTKSGGFNNASKGTIKDSYVRTGSTSVYTYVYYDRKGNQYDYVSSDSDKKDIIESVNVLDRNSFDMVEDWTVIKGVNDGQPILQFELKGQDINSGKVNFYGDISNDYKWGTGLSETEVKTLSSRIGKSTATHIDIVNGDKSGANSTAITLSELMSITTNGYVESLTQEESDISNDTNANNVYYVDSVVNKELNTSDNLKILTIKEYNFGVVTTTKKRIANIENKDFWLKENIDLSGKLWTPIGVGYNNYILGKDESVNTNTSYVNQISYPFNGTIAGNGYKITNMSVVGVNSNVGLFGVITSDSTNLSDSILRGMLLTNSTVIGVADNGYAVAGALAGRIIVPSLSNTNSTFNAYTKVGTQQANVYGSTRASGLIGDVLSLNSNFKPLEMTYSYVNSDVITSNNGFASAFINMGNDYTNGTSGSYTNTSINASVKEFYMAGNMYINGVISNENRQNENNSYSSLFGNFGTNKQETIRSVYVLDYVDSKKSTNIATVDGYSSSNILKTKDLDYFTWGNIWTRISTTTSDDPEIYNEGYPVLKNEIDYWALHTEEINLDSQIYIKNAGQLAKVAELVNTNRFGVGYTVILDNDIDLSGKIWTPIGYNQSRTFKGVFDFNGHSITGITITGVYLKSESTTSEKVVTIVETSDNKVEGLGLFGYLGNEATIKSTSGVGTLGKESDNSRIIGIGNVGALVGKAEETEIKNIVNNINVSSPTTESNRPTNGQSNYGVGGLIGHLVAKQSQEVVYENLTNNGNVTSTRPNVGGIVGYLYAKTTSSYKTTLKNFANNGAVYSSTSDAKNIGGLIGYNDGVNIDINGYDDTISDYSKITKNINTGAITGYEKVGGIVGYSTSGTIQNVINKGSIYATNGIAGGIVGEIDNMEVFEVINNAEISCGKNGNAIASIIGKLNSSRKSTISNLLNMYQTQNNDSNKYYGLIGSLSGNYDFYTAIDMATSEKESAIYGGTSLENANSKYNGANNHIIINKMFINDKSLLSEYPTDVYDGSKYATYLDVFNDNLLWDLNASDGYYLRFNNPISGDKLDPVDGKYVPTTQGHFNYLSDMNRKRFGVPCITYPIELSQNITLSNHKPLGKGAYPWKNNIDGNNYTITISGFTSGLESQSLLGNVSGTTVNNVVLSNLKIKYNISTIDKNSGFLMDTGFATSINNVEISQSDVDTISVSGVECFGTIASKLTSSTLDGVTNKQKLRTSSVNYVGGLVGKITNTNLNSCSNLSNITSTQNTALGGLVGNAIGELNSSNSPIYSIKNSSVAVDSTVSYTIDGNNRVGGLVGESQSYYYYANTFGSTKFSSNKFQGRNGFVKGSIIGGIIGTSDKDYIWKNTTYGEIITTNIGGGIVGQATGNGYSFPNESAVIYECENNSVVETSSNGKIVGGIVGKTEKKMTIKSCVNNVYGEAISYEYAGGIVGNADSTNITNCLHKGYSSSIGLSTEARVGGIAGYLSNSTLNETQVLGYVGVQASKNSTKRYNNYYSTYNMDSNNYNYNTFSYNSYNGKQGNYGKSDMPDGKYRYAYLSGESYNVTNTYDNTIDPQYSKFEIYDYYVNVATGHADGWFGIGYANINVDIMQRYGTLNNDGFTPITLETTKLNNKKAERRSVWFGYIDYDSVSVTVIFSAFGTSTFPANSDLEQFKIIYVDSNNMYNFSRYYYEGDSLYLPRYDGTNSTLDEWYTSSTGGTKIESTYKVAKNGIITFKGEDNSATIYARWSPKKWIVTLGNKYDAKDSGDMSAIGSISVVSGKTIDWTFKDYSDIASKITADPTDEKEGYKVLSWHTNSVSSWNDLVNKANGDKSSDERRSARSYLEGDPDSENGGLGLKHWEDAKVITSPWTAKQKTDSMYYKTEFDKNTTITENISLFAYYISIYQVKFDYNWKTDSGADGQTSTKVKVDAGEKVSAVKNPTRTGYTFKYWCTNQSGTQEFDFSTAITKNTVLYAKWEIQQFDVKFVYGLNKEHSQVKKINYNTILKSTDVPTEANINGYKLTWKDSSGNVVKFDGTYKITSNTTLTAYYEKEPYTVSFKVGNTDYIDPVTVYYGDKVPEPEPPTSSDPLEVFDYWCTDESLTKKYDFNSAVTNHLTLYAKFKTAQINVTYKFVDSSGTAIAGKSDYNITVNNGSTITRPSDTDSNFVIDGYELDGFFTDTSFASQYNFDAEVSTAQVIYAKYVKTYTVTFVVGARYTAGESTSQTITVRTGSTIPADSVPQVLTNVNKYGWLFVEGDVTSNEVDFNTYTVSEDVDLYYYATNDVQIVYMLEGDTDYTVFKTYSDIQYRSSVDRPDADLSVVGYRFDGYYSDSTFTSEFNFGTDIITTKDTKIYAKMIKQITISFTPYDEASVDASLDSNKTIHIDKDSVVSESDWIQFISSVNSSDIVWYYTDSAHTEKTEATLSELQSKSFTEDTVIYYKWNRGN